MAFPLGDNEIDAAEQTLGRRFPIEMRNRLSRSNGGEIEAADDDWILHPIRDASDRKRLSRTANDIIRETQNARQWHQFPDSGVAIAANGTGDLLVLLPESDDVHLWNHETGQLSMVLVDWS